MTAKGSMRFVVAVLIVVGLIMTLSAAFGQEKPKHKFYLDGKTRKTDGTYIATEMIVGDKESEGRYTIFHDIWKPGFSVGMHYHACHFETFILLDGEAEWTVGGETHHMKAGDAVYIPANTPHKAKTLGDKPAHFILVYSAGDYEAAIEREMALTEEQRKDPKMREMLQKLNDVNFVDEKKP